MNADPHSGNNASAQNRCADPAPELLHFLKDFGLVLFVFSLGMQGRGLNPKSNVE
jgi:hypothetical protein